jgi:hypothetical protein
MRASRPTALLALPALALTAVLLAGCAPGTPDDGADPIESSSTPSPTPTEADETDGPDPIDDAAAEAADAEMRANIVDAISSGNTAALDGYLAASVYVKHAASEQAGFVTDHTLLINNLSYVTSPTAVWDFNLPASLIDNYANNPGSAGSYVEDFPEGALVGRSSEDKVISFTIVGGLITRIFISNTEYALIFE